MTARVLINLECHISTVNLATHTYDYCKFIDLSLLEICFAAAAYQRVFKSLVYIAFCGCVDYVPYFLHFEFSRGKGECNRNMKTVTKTMRCALYGTHGSQSGYSMGVYVVTRWKLGRAATRTMHDVKRVRCATGCILTSVVPNMARTIPGFGSNDAGS